MIYRPWTPRRGPAICARASMSQSRICGLLCKTPCCSWARRWARASRTAACSTIRPRAAKPVSGCVVTCGCSRKSYARSRPSAALTERGPLGRRAQLPVRARIPGLLPRHGLPALAFHGLPALRRVHGGDVRLGKIRTWVDPARLEAAIDECVAFHGFCCSCSRTSRSAMSSPVSLSIAAPPPPRCVSTSASEPVGSLDSKPQNYTSTRRGLMPICVLDPGLRETGVGSAFHAEAELRRALIGSSAPFLSALEYPLGRSSHSPSAHRRSVQDWGQVSPAKAHAFLAAFFFFLAAPFWRLCASRRASWRLSAPSWRRVS